jgi:hypothetical protein
MDLFDRMSAYKKTHAGAIPMEETGRMMAIIDSVNSVKTEPEFIKTCNELKAAFSWLKQYLVSTDPVHQKKYLDEGQAHLQAARSELGRYSTLIEQKEREIAASSQQVTRPTPAPDPLTRQINEYDRTILSFLNIFNLIEDYRARNAGAVPEADFRQLVSISDSLDAIVPDADFEGAHRALMSSFHWMRQYLISTDPAHQKEYLERGQQELDAAAAELDRLRSKARKGAAPATPAPVSSPALNQQPPGKNLVITYRNAMFDFKSLFVKILAYKKMNRGAVPEPEMRQLRGIEEEISKAVPDPGLQRAHDALRSSFHWLKQYILSVNPEHQKKYIENGQREMQNADEELRKYEERQEGK